MRLFVGIDPGREGAVAVIDERMAVLSLKDSPLDAHGAIDFCALRSCLPDDPSQAVVVMEEVGAIPHWTKDRKRKLVPASDFAFGKSVGGWLGALGTFKVKPIMVAPKTWQAEMLKGLPVPPGAYKPEVLAARLFPGVASQLRGPLGGLKDGKVDALILAALGFRRWRLLRRAA